MDRSAVILGIAGLLATAGTSCAGLYFTYRTRTVRFRELLYTRQLDATIEILGAFTALGDRMTVLFGPHADIGAHDAVWHTVRQAADRVAALAPMAIAVLPRELYATYCTMHQDALELLRRIAYDDLPRSDLARFTEHGIQFAEVARTFLGVDSLSSESREDFRRSFQPAPALAGGTILPQRAPEAV